VDFPNSYEDSDFSLKHNRNLLADDFFDLIYGFGSFLGLDSVSANGTDLLAIRARQITFSSPPHKARLKCMANFFSNFTLFFAYCASPSKPDKGPF